MDHTYLATRYRKGGKDSQDSPSTAEARVKLAAIQRDHRSRRRAGETVPLTPTISQLRYFQGSEVAGEDARTGGFRGVGMVSKEGDDRGQFSESDIDAEDYANVLLSPARPRRYLEQLGIEPDSEPGEEDEDGDKDNDPVDGSPLGRQLLQPSARPRRGRRGPAPVQTATAVPIFGGEPAKDREFPSTVAIVYNVANWTTHCGGVLLNAHRVLTAAHCIQLIQEKADLSLFDVYAGSPSGAAGGIKANISGFIVHPNYNTSTKLHDIAILQLSTPLVENGLTISYAKLADCDSRADLGSIITVPGWF
ncbi:ATP-dependent DNA helicase PIF1, partial [Metarhizium majus ARSEF 297]